MMESMNTQKINGIDNIGSEQPQKVAKCLKITNVAFTQQDQTYVLVSKRDQNNAWQQEKLNMAKIDTTHVLDDNRRVPTRRTKGTITLRYTPRPPKPPKNIKTTT